MSRRRKIADTLDRLAAAEERAFACEFLSPMLRGGIVQIRIAGVVCRLTVQPADFEGLGRLPPDLREHGRAGPPARLAERQQYLELLALVRLILCHREDNQWFAVPAHRADSRFRIEGLVPVRLVEDARALRGHADPLRRHPVLVRGAGAAARSGGRGLPPGGTRQDGANPSA